MRKTSQEALTHAVPWVMVLEAIRNTGGMENPENSGFIGYTPIDTMVTYHGASSSSFSFMEKHPTCECMSPLLTWSDGAKFKIMCEFSTLSASHNTPFPLLLPLSYETVNRETEAAKKAREEK